MKEGSRAENAGIKLGDSIVTINDKDTSKMTLQEANNVLEQAAQHDVKLGVIKWVSNRFLLRLNLALSRFCVYNLGATLISSQLLGYL